jgi:hypothetical protein
MQEDTDIITIRVPKSLKDKLEDRSKKQDHTLNLTINKILAKEVEWDDYLAEMRWLQFDPNTIRVIFSHLNEEQIKEIAKQIKHDVISAVKFIYEHPTLENTIDFIKSWLKSANMSFRHTSDENIHKFVVNHELGKNWSLFAISVTDEFLTELGFKQTTTAIESKTYRFDVSIK